MRGYSSLFNSFSFVLCRVCSRSIYLISGQYFLHHNLDGRGIFYIHTGCYGSR